MELLDNNYEQHYEDINFSNYELTGLSFENCEFTSCFFKDSALTNMVYTDCDFMRVDFRIADFTGSKFGNVTFGDCNLEKAAFRKAEGYSINPESNTIKNALFSLPDAQSYLAYLGIKIDY